MRRLVKWALGCAMFLVLMLLGLVVLAERQLAAPGLLGEARTVVVPHGTPGQLGTVLASAGIVRDALSLRVATVLTGSQGPLHAGEFTFPAHASLRDVLAVLRTARPVQHRLTIPEGLTAAQIAELFVQAEALSGDAAVPNEGEIFPDTYLYERGETRLALMHRGMAAMQQAVKRLWAQRAAALPLSSPDEFVTLASIVERETARPEERPMVAAVFLNRLRYGMRLQSDPTVLYAVSGGVGVLGRGLSRADLDWDNPYNTYRVAGLPPGPIASPGVAAMQAVAQPAATDALYFVADGMGGHAFARTEEEHNRNVARWRALQRSEPAKPGEMPPG